MCLQAIGDYVAFLQAVESKLAIGGAFLLSIPHPAFFNDYKKVIQPREFQYMREKSALIDFQITLDSQGTIEQVPYFHRSLTNYISALANAGLNLSFFKEIFPTAEIQALYGKPWSTPRYLLLGGNSAKDNDRPPVSSVAVRLAEIERRIASEFLGREP
jgi:hypothetical protein